MEVTTIFSNEEINQQARRILNSPSFKNSPILSKFLEFIVAETLDKRELYIKEYTIAIQALGRSRDFNASTDCIVRIHAGRLRRALTDYYLTDGMYDPIIIQIPKGRYIPEFIPSGTEERMVDQEPASSQKRHKPQLAIFPLRIATDEEDKDKLQTLLEGQLREELLRFLDIAVIGYYSTDMKAKIEENVLEAGKLSGADYVITGSLIYIGQHLLVRINLLVPETGEVLLCKSFNRNILPPLLIESSDNIFKYFVGFANDCYRSIRKKQKYAI